jgi:GNAT superfamily N-acetyltransferase
MKTSATAATVEEIKPWRDLYRHEMNCQIVADSLDSRKGWTQPYFLSVDGSTVGYGSVAIGGPWKDRPTIFQYYVLPQHRSRVFDFFEALLAASRAMVIHAQTNDTLLTTMLHAYGRSIESESIIFQDRLTTWHPARNAVFRKARPDDAGKVFEHKHEPEGDWVIESEGRIAATGGILFHYNRPYGDIFMEVAEPFRRRGFGSYLVQELKRVCYEQGNVPAARCSPKNIASRETLQKAGFVPCGHILNGAIPATATPTNAVI